MFKRYYCVRQLDLSDCGPACLGTIALQHGVRIPLHKIREKAGTDLQGTNMIGMVQAAERIGLDARGIKAKKKHLKPDSIPYPAIAHIVKPDIEHYVVVHKVTKKKVYIADPGSGLEWVSWDEFMNIWTGALIITSPKADFTTQKSEKKIGLFKRFWSTILPFKALVVEIGLAALLLAILGFVGAFYYRFLIDTILPSKSFEALTGLTLLIIFISFFQILLGSFRNHITMHLANKVDVTLITNFFKHIIHLPLKFFETRKSGEILARIGDTVTIRQTLYGTIIGTVLDVLMLFVGLFGIFFFDISLIMIAIVPFTITMILVYVFRGPFKKMQKEKFKIDADKDSQFYETVAGISTVKAMGAESEFMGNVEEKFMDSVRYGMKMGIYTNVQSTIQQFVSTFGGLAVFWVGSFFILNGSVTLGEIISFNAFMGMFLGPLGRLISLQASLQNAFLASDRIGEILDMDSELEMDQGSISFNIAGGDIHFDNVTFAYSSRGSVLKNINCMITHGEKIGIVGPTGSGKSTFVKLLLKFYRVEEGAITLDGNNINSIDTTTLRGSIGYVPQEVLLFSGTIRENLALGARNISDEYLIEIAKKSRCWEFIEKFPEKLDAKVSERGTSLSGGERQRIALARALVRRPSLFVLDEATSNLDAITERAIQNTISEICQYSTTIIIAHRLSTIRDCTRILYLEEGEIKEQGSHKELMQLNGKYSQLWSSQMGEMNHA